MKIKGKDWMDWLHKSRAESQDLRKSKRQPLSNYLRTLEHRTSSSGKKTVKSSAKKGKLRKSV